MKPITVFEKQWLKIKSPLLVNYRIIENYKLKNDAMADIAIFSNDNCIAFGNYFDKLQLPSENDELRFYFHGNHRFIGCGASSLFWFYFDNKDIIVNDHRYNYPYDEIMGDYNDFFSRLTQDTN